MSPPKRSHGEAQVDADHGGDIQGEANEASDEKAGNTCDGVGGVGVLRWLADVAR